MDRDTDIGIDMEMDTDRGMNTKIDHFIASSLQNE
jgi:hypothetical protein